MHFKIKEKYVSLAYWLMMQPACQGFQPHLVTMCSFTWGMGWDGMGWGLVGWVRQHYTTILGKYL